MQMFNSRQVCLFFSKENWASNWYLFWSKKKKKKKKAAQLLNIKGKKNIFIYHTTTSPYFKIKKLNYNDSQNLMQINDDISINITPEEYNFYVGSRYPVQEWLEHRKNADISLNTSNRERFEKILLSIDKLIEIEVDLNQFLNSINFNPIDLNDYYELIMKNLTKKGLIECYKKNKNKPVRGEKIIKYISKNYSADPSEFLHISFDILEKIATKRVNKEDVALFAPNYDKIKKFL